MSPPPPISLHLPFPSPNPLSFLRTEKTKPDLESLRRKLSRDISHPPTKKRKTNPTNTIMSNNNSRSNTTTTTHACAACKYQRRKCAPDCVLAPYFPHHRQRQFLNAHKLFGVRNITKTIENLHDPCLKDQVMRSIIFQSDARANDPVGGCYRIICELKREIEYAMVELELVLQQLALCRSPPVPHHQPQNLPLPNVHACESSIPPDPMSYDPHIQHSNVEGGGEYFLNEPSSQDAAASWGMQEAAMSSSHDRKSFGNEECHDDFKPNGVDVGVLLLNTERIELESDEAISKDNKVIVKDEIAAFIETAGLAN